MTNNRNKRRNRKPQQQPQRRSENELQEAMAAGGEFTARLEQTAAFRARETGMPVDRRLLESAELNAFVEDGRLLTDEEIACADPAHGPVCTTNREYWGIETVSDWLAWVRHEMDVTGWDEDVPENLGLMREKGWNQSADMIMQARQTFAAIG